MLQILSWPLTPLQASTITVKVHYSTTRAVRISSTITYQQLQHLICKKFERPEGSLTLWCKKKQSGELNEIYDEQTLKTVSASLDDGFRLTLWAYDKHEVYITHLELTHWKFPWLMKHSPSKLFKFSVYHIQTVQLHWVVRKLVFGCQEVSIGLSGSSMPVILSIWNTYTHTLSQLWQVQLSK